MNFFLSKSSISDLNVQSIPADRYKKTSVVPTITEVFQILLFWFNRTLLNFHLNIMDRKLCSKDDDCIRMYNIPRQRVFVLKNYFYSTFFTTKKAFLWKTTSSFNLSDLTSLKLAPQNTTLSHPIDSNKGL